jgi:HEAT repeat protein
VSVLDQLASALERNDERPNVELAQALVAKPDRKAIATLADALSTGSVAVQNDAIKVLYEIGERAPELVAPHAEAFLALLKSKNNRNVWGAMSAIDTIALVKSKEVAAHLKDILGAADKGSVIAKDKAMSTLSKLAQAGEAKAMPALLERLENAAPNQFPMYAELAASAVTPAHKARLVAILETRLGTIDAAAKKARVEKVLRKLAKG